MDLPVCYTPLWVSPSDKPVDDRLVNSCQVLRYQYIYYMPLWAHVQVLAAYILMQPDDIGLVPVTELFHELLRQYGHLFFGKNVVGGWIQGDVDNRFPDVRVECDIRLESLHAVFNRHITGSVRHYFRMSQNLCRTVVHLYFIIGNHSVKRIA